jgi:hypothetical protein
MEISLEIGEYLPNKFIPYLGPNSVTLMDSVSCRSIVFDKAPNKGRLNSNLALQK